MTDVQKSQAFAFPVIFSEFKFVTNEYLSTDFQELASELLRNELQPPIHNTVHRNL